MINKKIILFGTEGRNLLGQLRTFGELGFRPTLVIVSSNGKSYYIKKSKYIGEFFVVKTNEDGLRFIIDRYGQEKHKPFLFTDADSIISLFDKKYDILIDRFYFFNAGGAGRLTPYMNKQFLCEAANKLGINIPKTEKVKVGDLPTQLKFPIFTKAVDSLSPNWTQNAFVCYNEDELYDAYKKIKVDSILLQEYVKKKNECILEGVSYNDGKFVFIPVIGRYYRINPTSYSQYAYYVKFDEESEIVKLLREIKFNGIFEAEYMEAENGKYFLEINFRQTAFNRAITRMGVCLEKIWIESVESGQLKVNNISIKKEPWNLMDGIGDFMTSVIRGNLSFAQWLKDVRKTDSFMIYDRADVKPFVFFICHYINGLIIAVMRKIKKMFI